MHLQQVFQNLIGNAIKYRNPQRSPVVQITAERQDGYWTFSVSDNGIGIDPEYRENIFGLFKRTSAMDIRELGSGWPSASESWIGITAGSGLSPNPAAERPSALRFPPESHRPAFVKTGRVRHRADPRRRSQMSSSMRAGLRRYITGTTRFVRHRFGFLWQE